MKKLLIILLACVMVFTLIPVTALAAKTPAMNINADSETIVTGELNEAGNTWVFTVPEGAADIVKLDFSGYIDYLIKHPNNPYYNPACWIPHVKSKKLPVKIQNSSLRIYHYDDTDFTFDTDASSEEDLYYVLGSHPYEGQERPADVPFHSVLRVQAQPIQSLYYNTLDLSTGSKLTIEQIVGVEEKIGEHGQIKANNKTATIPTDITTYGQYVLWYYNTFYLDTASQAAALADLPMLYKLNALGFAYVEGFHQGINPEKLQPGNAGASNRISNKDSEAECNTWIAQITDYLNTQTNLQVLGAAYEIKVSSSRYSAEYEAYLLERDTDIIKLAQDIFYQYGLRFTFDYTQDKNKVSFEEPENLAGRNAQLADTGELSWSALCDTDFSAAALADDENLTYAQQAVKRDLAGLTSLAASGEEGSETLVTDPRLSMASYAVLNAHYFMGALSGLGLNVTLKAEEGQKTSAPGMEKKILTAVPIVCLGDTFRSGGSYISIVVDGRKILTTKDRFAFEGDHSTDELIAGFLANNPDAEGHNEHQWGYKAEIVEGRQHCLRIVPFGDTAGYPIGYEGANWYLVGLGGHEHVQHPENYPLDVTFENVEVDHADVQPGGTVTFVLKSNVPDYLGDYIDAEEPWPPVQDPPNTPAPPANPGDEPVIPGRGEYILTFHDKLDPAMTYADSLTVTVNGVTLDPSLYTVTLNPEDGCTFHVVMDLVEIYNTPFDNSDPENPIPYFSFEDIESSPPIVVTYNATVNEETTHGAYPNEAWVTYEDAESEHDIVYVHVYAIDVLKYDQTDNAALAGAEFVLFNADHTKIAAWEFVAAADNKPAYYRFKEWNDTPTGNPPAYTDEMIFTSGEDGMVLLEGLLPGEYLLKEVKAPDGYIMSDTELKVTIPSVTAPIIDPIDEAAAHIVHTQFANSNIPHTGGSGTRLFTLVGSALLIMAAAVLCFRRKRENFA